MKQLTQRNFRKYLESLPPDDHLFEPKNPYFCPIAHFLNGTRGHIYSVGQRQYKIPSPGRRAVNMPAWASKFVIKVDYNCGYPGKISPSIALKILSEVEED